MKFRKKPVVIEAIQWIGQEHPGVSYDGSGAYVVTVHGEKAHLTLGDWIIPEPMNGRFYPCKPAIFAMTYEAVE